MRATRTAFAILAVVGLSLSSVAVPGAGAQTKVGGLNLEGDIEAGGRFFIERPSPTRRGKFEEYRDINQGVFLEGMRLRIFTDDEAFYGTFGGSKWGLDDQEFTGGVGQLGVWGIQFDWDQTPHIYSTTAKTRANEVDRGVWRLPSTRPDATSISPAEGALYNAANDFGELGVRWDTARLTLFLTPTPEWDLRAQYTRIHKEGDRPFSVAMGSPGSDFIEIPSPIEHIVHDLRLRGTYARETWQIQFGYNFSLFHNQEDSVTADNPLRRTFSVFAPSATGGSSNPAFGRVSLEPDNSAHSFYVQGGVDLPARTRLQAGVNYSLRLQNDDFLSHTVNPNIANAPGAAALLALPQDSLEGMAGITNFNVNLVNRALSWVTFNARYRLFNHHEFTDELLFPAHVVNDQSLAIEDRRNSAFSYTKQNADIDARFRPLRTLGTTIGVGWERWDRPNEHREVPTSNEYFIKFANDWTPTDWLLARLTYKPSWRRIDEYNTFAHIAHTVFEEDLTGAEAAQSQSTLLRKFDEGERNRQQLDLLLQFTPLDTLTVSLNGSWRDDKYLGGEFGLRDGTTWTAGIDANWAPVERMAFFAGYVYENIFQKWKSRNRDVATVAGVSVVSDFEDWNWISTGIDQVHTLYIGTNVTLIPKKLIWSAQANIAYALGDVDTRNETAPLPHPPGFPNPANAVARPQPAFEDTFIRVETAFRYWLTPQWAASFGYAFESWQKNDWRTDRLNPFIPGVNSIFLGNDLRNYTAHMIGATLRYSFR